MSIQLKLKLVRLCFDHTLCSPPLSTVGEIFFSLAGYTCPKTGRIEVTLPCMLELSIKLSLCHQFESDLKFPLSLYLLLASDPWPSVLSSVSESPRDLA